MAQLGKATVKIEADTKDAMRAVRRLKGELYGRISWSETTLALGLLSFVAYLLRNVT